MTDVSSQYNFDEEGVYHTGSVVSQEGNNHEALMAYLHSLPPETTHGLMRVSRANHWNKNRASGMELIRKLQRTHTASKVGFFSQGVILC